MKINKAEYEIDGLTLVLIRGTGTNVKIDYNMCGYEWDADTDDTDEVWAIADEMYRCFYDGNRGTRGDVDELYRAIMAFEN